MQIRRATPVVTASWLASIMLALAGCASFSPPGGSQGGSADGSASAPAAAAQLSASATAATRAAAPARTTAPAGAGGLVVLHDPGQVTGTLAGPCQARGNGGLPDPLCTPGGTDPAVTQANIGSTICSAGYTATVRPPEAQTEAFKFNDAYPAYGIPSGTQTELDHLVPLELGGDNDAANLWPEVPPSPNPKDSVEDALNRAVCEGRVSLASAQIAIAQDWQTAESRLGLAAAPAPAQPQNQPPPVAPPAGGMSCSASVSNTSPADYTTVAITVQTAAGALVTTVAHYKTTDHQKAAVADGSGVATIDYDISGATPGFTVNVGVTASAGSQSAQCSTSFTPVS